MSQGDLRRFFKETAVAREDDGSFTVRLDGRSLRTPAKRQLAVEREALAAAIAEEWQAQGEKLRPESMPLTALVCTATDLVSGQRDKVVGELADFAGTELLCYRAEAPGDLVSRQQALWQPLLDWAALTYDAPLTVTTALLACDQPAASLSALARAVAAHDDLALSGLASAVQSSGSLIIGLALSAGRLDATAAFEAAELDETYNIEQWGEDAEAGKRRAALRAELAAVERLFRLLQN
jgi:chaperone required for assembly of F1-ATPase